MLIRLQHKSPIDWFEIYIFDNRWKIYTETEYKFYFMTRKIINI